MNTQNSISFLSFFLFHLDLNTLCIPICYTFLPCSCDKLITVWNIKISYVKGIFLTLVSFSCYFLQITYLTIFIYIFNNQGSIFFSYGLLKCSNNLYISSFRSKHPSFSSGIFCSNICAVSILICDLPACPYISLSCNYCWEICDSMILLLQIPLCRCSLIRKIRKISFRFVHTKSCGCLSCICCICCCLRICT